ncbi:hypothetical protein [uncultured Nostoc sp.]
MGKSSVSSMCVGAARRRQRKHLTQNNIAIAHHIFNYRMVN